MIGGGCAIRETIQTILEAIGLLESKQTALKRKLAVISRAQPQGEVSLIVRQIGPKPNSAVSALREVTGLDLREVVLLVTALPAPLFTHISPETAESIRARLRKVGIEVEIVGLPQATSRPAKPAAATQAASTSLKFPIVGGDYAAVLVKVGLLAERVMEGVQKLTGLDRAEVDAFIASLPQPVLVGVDMDTAIKGQTLLQMVGAVVDIVTIEEYEATETSKPSQT